MKNLGKMKNFKLILALSLSICIILFACDKDITVSQNKKQEAGEITNIVNESSILYKGESKYAKYFASVDSEAGFASQRQTPKGKRDLNFYSPFAKSSLKSVTTRQIKVNGISIASSLKSVSNIETSIEKLFGQNVVFEFVSKNNNKSSAVDETSSDSITMYIPEVIELSYPVSADSFYIACNYDNLKLQWNADTKNENGIVIFAEWSGVTYDEDNFGSQYIRNIDIVEDTGECILKPEIFNGMPHTAFVTVTILRGNIAISEIDNEVTKLYGASEASVECILIKE